MSKEKLNAAIIGLGQIGFSIKFDKLRKRIWAHSEAYTKHARTELIAGADISEEACISFERSYPKVSTYFSYKEMLRKQDIDILSICVHEELCAEVLDYVITNHESIKAIFCEKPISRDSEKIKEIIKKSDHKGISICVNYFRRWEDSYNICKNIIESNKYGKLRTIIGLGATALITSSSHLLDVLISLSPEIEKIFSIKQEDFIRKVNNKEDPGYSVLMSCKNGANIFLNSTSKNSENFTFEIMMIFDEARVVWKDGINSIDIYEHSLQETYVGKGYSPLSIKPKSIEFVQKETMLDAISQLVNTFEGNIDLSSDIYNAEQVVRLIELISLSARNNSIIYTNGQNYEK